jgi:phosphoribosyl 1,2-cyclic phosphodiesterase
MSASFTVLASGSGGNASLLQYDHFGLLIDFGLGSRTLGKRLAARGFSWHSVHAVLLTHTHSDHWNETSLAMIANHGVPLYCHADHAQELSACSSEYLRLQAARRVIIYEPERWFTVGPGLRVLPLPVSHDCGTTCSFRIEGPEGLFGPSWAVGYICDLGNWTPDLPKAFADVDLLAVEFNHDEQLQRTSGRPQLLIDRVLGDFGHLSNRQGAAFVAACREASAVPCLKYLVTLHRSRQCNTTELVRECAHGVLSADDALVRLIQAEQHEPTPTLLIGDQDEPAKPRPRVPRRLRTPAIGIFDDLDDSGLSNID